MDSIQFKSRVSQTRDAVLTMGITRKLLQSKNEKELIRSLAGFMLGMEIEDGEDGEDAENKDLLLSTAFCLSGVINGEFAPVFQRFCDKQNLSDELVLTVVMTGISRFALWLSQWLPVQYHLRVTESGLLLLSSEAAAFVATRLKLSHPIQNENSSFWIVPEQFFSIGFPRSSVSIVRQFDWFNQERHIHVVKLLCTAFAWEDVQSPAVYNRSVQVATDLMVRSWKQADPEMHLDIFYAAKTAASYSDAALKQLVERLVHVLDSKCSSRDRHNLKP